MSNEVLNQPVENHDSKVRVPYEAPAIVYEGLITTRAGTGGVSNPGSSESGVDTTDIFKN